MEQILQSANVFLVVCVFMKLIGESYDCVTGFNAGHSDFAFMTARKNIKMYAFDVGRYRYVMPMVHFLQQMFPGRLSFMFGDAGLTVPRFFNFSSVIPTVTCDIMLVDTMHIFYLAMNEIRNFARIASQPLNIIIADDYNYPGVRQAWEIAEFSGILRTIFHTCHQKRATAVGIIIGQHENTKKCRTKQMCFSSTSALIIVVYVFFLIVLFQKQNMLVGQQ